MTERIFYNDSYCSSFEGVVTECIAKDNFYWVSLDRTAFFPEGGGQSGDCGQINGIEVTDTIEKAGTIYHIMGEAVEAGTKVRGEVDVAERFSKMQQHTGEHIVSGLIHQRFGYDNVGFHLGKEAVTMDFNGTFSEEELKEIEEQANAAVSENLTVNVGYPDKEELKKLEYRSKIEIEGQVRIVSIPGIDRCACCAPHVKCTGEIGMIKITDAVRYKGGTRVSMLCGFRALEYVREIEKNIKEISVLLSSKIMLTSDAVKRQKEEVSQLKNRIFDLQEQYIVDKLEHLAETDKEIVLFFKELDSNMVRKLINDGMTKTGKYFACFTGTDQEGYRFVIGSENLDVRTVSAKLSERFHAKGGGSSKMVQGSVAAGRFEIESVLAEAE